METPTPRTDESSILTVEELAAGLSADPAVCYLTQEGSERTSSTACVAPPVAGDSDKASLDVTIEELSPSAIDDILHIAKERAALLERLREAIRNNEGKNVQKLAAELCGLANPVNFEE